MTASVTEIRTTSRRVRQFRNAHGLTKRALADKAGLSVSTVSRIEKGVETGYNTHVATLSSLARALDVKVGEITNRGYLFA